MNNISIWNGYPVHGDIKELDRLVESDGFICLNKDDIMDVLSADGTSYIITGIGDILGEAFNNAVNDLPCKIDPINKLLIDFCCGTRQPDMAELSSISSSLSEANEDIDVMWGMTSDDSLGESYKVVLLASLKA